MSEFRWIPIVWKESKGLEEDGFPEGVMMIWSDMPMPDFTVYTVWKCKILQNWKYLISSTLFDGMYYELTYNGDKHEWYLDAYKKFENKVIK